MTTAKLENCNLVKQEINNTGIGTIWLNNTVTDGYLRLQDVFSVDTYFHYCIIDGDNREIGLGEYVRDLGNPSWPGGYLNRKQALEVLNNGVLAKTTGTALLSNRLFVTATALVLCAPTSYSLQCHTPVWKRKDADFTRLPSIPGTGWPSTGWGSTEMQHYAKAWFSSGGTEELNGVINMPLDFWPSTAVGIYATVVASKATTDPFMPSFTFSYWPISHTNRRPTDAGFFGPVPELYENINTGSRIRTSEMVELEMDSYIQTLTSPVFSSSETKEGAVGICCLGVIAGVTPGMILPFNLVRDGTDDPACNVGILNLYAMYQSNTLGAGNFHTVGDPTYPDEVALVTRRHN